MARRKDHSPEALRALIVQAACDLVSRRGRAALTARNLAAQVGYAPGTIYNLFPDMDAVLLAVQGQTLESLRQAFDAVIADTAAGFGRIRALSHAYGAFAREKPCRWLALFAAPHRGKLPRWYQRQLDEIFALIEAQLRLCLGQSQAESRQTARLLWACLHGITMLTLDGRLQGIGRSDERALVEELLRPYRPSSWQD